MNWTTATMLVLAAALAAGFTWFERTRPAARIVALVGGMAALAVVGRLAFAPLPNVKPTTDIVLFAGYALGGAPGFAVGAITALASNVFLGQGPWTPWQMAAWGGVGIAGAALARFGRGRELGRWALAAACGVAGLAFGAFMDVYQTSFTANPGLGSYGVVATTSLPYNLAHAIGNVVFCLAFGPAMIRALRRYKQRFEVRWAPAAAAALIGVVVFAGAAAPSASASTSSKAAGYLAGAQNADGGWGPAPGAGSSQLYTGWTALGLAAAGRNPGEVQKDGKSPLDFARAGIASLDDAGEIERTMLFVGAAGGNPRSFGGKDLIAALAAKNKPNGSIGGLVNITSFGILALKAAGQGNLRRPSAWLARQQNRDGGYGFGPRSGASDVDDTGAAVQALVAAGRRGSPAVRRSVAYLKKAQNPDGGFSSLGSGTSNAQSTAWAIQGLVAARTNPDSLKKGSRTPLAYLASLQASDGSIRYSRTSAQTPVWVTGQALTALERKPFPIARLARTSVARKPEPTAAIPRKPARKRVWKEAERQFRKRPIAPAALIAHDRAVPGAETPALQPAQRTAGRQAAPSPWPFVLLAAGAVAIPAGLWWRRRRRA